LPQKNGPVKDILDTEREIEALINVVVKAGNRGNSSSIKF
jgi:hypothetical protein